MSEGPLAPRPLLHPVLTLRTKPAKKGAPGGSKKEKDVVVSRLAEQRRFLASRVRQIRGGTHPRFGSHMLLVVEMFPDSQATSKTPRDLFNGLYGATFLRGAAVDGYLAEVTDEDLLTLETRIAKGESIPVRCDISRVKDVRPFAAGDVLRGRPLSRLWGDAPEVDGGRAFFVWLLPFRHPAARANVIKSIRALREAHALAPTSPRLLIQQVDNGSIVVPERTERLCWASSV